MFSLSLNHTFEECAKDALGTVYADIQLDDVRVLIMRGPASVNAYLGFREGHPWYGKEYEDIEGIVECHGGLTYSGKDERVWPAGYWWIGWDYAHAGDVNFYDIDPVIANLRANIRHPIWSFQEVAWTPAMILAQIPDVLACLPEV
jgi:hypothetical protein